MTKRSLLAIGAGCMVLIGGGAAVAASQDDGDRAGAPQTPVLSADASPAAGLSVFRGARSGGDALPSPLAETIGARQPDGANVELSRRAFVHGDTSGYVVPSAKGVCMWLVRPESSVGGCGATGQAPGVATGPTRTTFYGTVPNGVDAVTIAFADGTSSQVRSQGNAYSIDVAAGPTPKTITYTDPSRGKVTHELFVPDLDAISRQAAQEPN